MKKTLLLSAAILLASLASFAQPAIQWQKSLGGTGLDAARSIQQTTDGGYIVAGESQSSNGDVTGRKGYGDYWIVKLDDTGNLQWQKTLGGTETDYANSIQQTTDGGYIVAGSSNSTNGDVTGNKGGWDCWIVKLDDTGGIVWQKTLGGSGIDGANSIQQTTDGGYIVAGSSNSTNGDVTGNKGASDYWIVKLDDTGSITWQKTLGGTGIDGASSIQQTTDGGYIVAGSSNSTNGDVTGSKGGTDYWIVKLDNIGSLQWQKSYGGSGNDYACSIQQTTDGSYIVAGWSNSTNGDVTGSKGVNDYWVIKLDDTGSIIWQKSLGGSGTDDAYSIQQTTDGSYIVAGWSNSTNGDVTGAKGNDDYWIIKLDDTGSIIWQKSLGGSGIDGAQSIQQTADGGYIVAGASHSTNGDVTGNKGSWDYWIVKLCSDPLPVITQDGHTLSTDSFASYQWYFNDTLLTGAENRTHTATAEGTYTVSVTDENDCEGVSQGYVFSRAGVSPLAFGERVRIYPNPSQGVVNIEAEESFAYSVYDIHGKLITQGNATTNFATVENLTSGLYFIRLQTGESVKTVKVLVE